jgi:hypothetical protein
MTTTSPNAGLLAEGRAWAAKQLGVDASQPAEELHKALLRQLRQEDFLPDENWQALARVAAGLRPPAELTPVEVVQTDFRSVLHEQVEGFAKDFFRTAPQTRHARYEELRQRCANLPCLSTRLMALEPGLDVVVPPPASGEHPDLALLRQTIIDMFPLRPHERAVLRQRLRKHTIKDPKVWGLVASILERDHPEIARLDAEFVGELSGWQAIEREQKKQRRKRRKTAERTQSAGRSSFGESWGSGKTWIWVCVWAVIMVGRCATYDGWRYSRSRPSYTAPTYVPPRSFTEDPNVTRGLRVLQELERRKRGVGEDPSPDALPPEYFEPKLPSDSTPRSKVPPKYDDFRQMFKLPPSDGRPNRVAPSTRTPQRNRSQRP